MEYWKGELGRATSQEEKRYCQKKLDSIDHQRKQCMDLIQGGWAQRGFGGLPAQWHCYAVGGAG